MEREYLGGDVIVWRRPGSGEVVDIERVGSNPNGYIALTVYCNVDSPTCGIKGRGTQWLTPQEAREVAKALNAYAETIEQDKGYCHDPFVEEQ